MAQLMIILSKLVDNDILAYSVCIFYCRPASERYKTLLVIMEKLYLAIVELGFSPTEGEYHFNSNELISSVFVSLELQRTLLDVSFRVMPFDRFIAAVDQNILTLTYEFVQQVLTGKENSNV